MTFGYITLFSASFPFGTTIMSLFVYMETKQDCFKLITVSKRPFVRKAANIGVWEGTLDFFTVMSIFTNLYLACIASNQIDAILPSGFHSNNETTMLTEFALEHLLVIIVIWIRVVLSGETHWLRVYKQRKKHKEEIRQLSESKMKRYTLIMRFVKSQIAARFKKNKPTTPLLCFRK